MKNKNPFIGKVCVVRINKSGVHVGTVIAMTRQSVTLSNYVRLWSWTALSGYSVDALANVGVKSAKFDRGTLKKIDREEGGEIVVCTDVAVKSVGAL